MNDKRPIPIIFIVICITLLLVAPIILIVIRQNETSVIEQQLVISSEKHKVFLPTIITTRPKVFAGAEYEGGGLTTWAAYNNPNTNNKISIYVPDIIDYAYDYNIDWTIPDKKINNINTHTNL